jgi:DNA-binding CsgD family transcriptional regulator
MTYPLSIAEACYDDLAERVRAACPRPGSSPGSPGNGVLDGERLYLALHDELLGLAIKVAQSRPARGDRGMHERRARRLLDGIAARQRELHGALDALRTRRLSRIVESMTWLDSAESPAESPAELARRAPAALCAAGDFDRVMISQVHGSLWVPAAVHIAAGADDEVNLRLLAAIGVIQVPLTSSLVETGVLRHRAPALVEAAMSGDRDNQLRALSRSRSYVVAPIVVADRVTGFLHADTYTSQRTLTAADKANVQAFADMFGLLYERAAMAQRLRDQRQAVTDALSGAIAEPRMRTRVDQLARPERLPIAVAAEATWPPAARNGLTSHEWEILRLLATGATNSQIASALVISESTVKSHIKRILRKLPAANRAEAVYRYTKLAGEVSRAS